jgi:hypothetical protein
MNDLMLGLLHLATARAYFLVILALAIIALALVATRRSQK